MDVPVIVAGDRREMGGHQLLPVRSPATGTVLGDMARATREDIDAAVAAARAAAGQLARMTPRERGTLLAEVAAQIDTRAAEIAEALTDEQGKPLGEARGEVAAASAMWRESAEIVRHLHDEILPSDDPAWSVLVVHRPHGVLGVITPWNFPISIPTEYLAAGLGMGNAVVWKPSELTPIVATFLVACIESAGFPAGAVNLVPGLGADVGEAIVSHPGVDAVGFTGSPESGAMVARNAGPKPVLLELGGNNATVILKDADVGSAAKMMLEASYTNAGQTCAATERILVERPAYDAVARAIADQVAALRLGLPRDASTEIGPLNNEPTAAKVDRHIADAVTKGATVLVGGGRAPGFPTDLFYEPTVLTGLTTGMDAFGEETFGPLVALMPFDSDDQVVDLVNGHRLGLVAGIVGHDTGRALEIGRRLEAGIVNIGQTASYWQPHTPFGGFSGRASGVGRLGGRYTLEALSQLQTFVVPRRLLP